MSLFSHHGLRAARVPRAPEPEARLFGQSHRNGRRCRLAPAATFSERALAGVHAEGAALRLAF